MGQCDVCDKEETHLFSCSYCDLSVCTRHRLPENHNCAGLKRTQDSKTSAGSSTNSFNPIASSSNTRFDRINRRNFLFGVLFAGIAGAFIAAPGRMKSYFQDFSEPQKPLEERAEEVEYSVVKERIDQYEGELVLFENFDVASITPEDEEAESSRWVVIWVSPDSNLETTEALYSKISEPVPESEKSYDVYCTVKGIKTYQALGGATNAIEINVKKYDEVDASE